MITPAHLNPYQKMQNAFRWQIPEYFNIASACLHSWQKEGTARLAIIEHHSNASPLCYTYAQMHQAANNLSAQLIACGIHKGDRVAMVLPQSFATAVGYMAIFQIGAIAVPLSTLFGDEALQYRLNDSGAKIALIAPSPSAVFADEIAKWQTLRTTCRQLQTLIGWGFLTDEHAPCDIDGATVVAQNAPTIKPLRTQANDPALLIYTSGTTGNPKGALIPHRALIGNLSGFMSSQNGFGFWENCSAKTALDRIQNPHRSASSAIFWSPADWAWTGGLMDALLPSLFYGRPIVACAERFTAELAFNILEQHAITHTFLFPTALKAMMKHFPHPQPYFRLALQAIMSAGETVGSAVFEYCQRELGVVVNEMFGQTEINYLVGNCALSPRRKIAQTLGWRAKPGSIGRGYWGHRVALLNDQGAPCALGEVGEIALHRYNQHGQADPIFFLGYWNNPKATCEKFVGGDENGWCKTGDLAQMDEEGYLWYQGRADDVFKSSGYRIGPGEIENALLKHPAVANTAVVPKPDAERGAVVKAYVVLTEDCQNQCRALSPSSAQTLKEQWIREMQSMVRQQLAPYEYPKEIEWIDKLPMTTTGKVQRRLLRLQELERAAQNPQNECPL